MIVAEKSQKTPKRLDDSMRVEKKKSDIALYDIPIVTNTNGWK